MWTCATHHAIAISIDIFFVKKYIFFFCCIFALEDIASAQWSRESCQVSIRMRHECTPISDWNMWREWIQNGIVTAKIYQKSLNLIALWSRVIYSSGRMAHIETIASAFLFIRNSRLHWEEIWNSPWFPFLKPAFFSINTKANALILLFFSIYYFFNCKRYVMRTRIAIIDT